MRDYRQYHVKVVNDTTHELVTLCITRARSSREALANVAKRTRVKAMAAFTLTVITAERYLEITRVWEGI